MSNIYKQCLYFINRLYFKVFELRLKILKVFQDSIKMINNKKLQVNYFKNNKGSIDYFKKEIFEHCSIFKFRNLITDLSIRFVITVCQMLLLLFYNN